MSTPQIVRLITGEELLCTIESNNGKQLVIKDPFVILPTQEGNLQFMRYMGYAVFDTLPIKTDNIMWVVEPNRELVLKHNEMTGAIDIPDKKIIT